MLFTDQSTTRSRLWLISSSLLITSAIAVSAQDIYLCVWRNPERTMTKIFPDARDYKTVNRAITPQERASIEGKLGFALLPGQQDQFQYFEMVGDGGKIIGTIIAVSQKGEYGAIEFVFGMDSTGAIKGIYIQRSRERDQDFKKKDFLDRFIGKRVEDAETLLPSMLETGHSHGSAAVIRGLTKELVAYRVLVGKK
ncbi:MAG: hypothetical protein JXA71_02105 [Chitinispirillaceae bacterium]|nr:hypothetical protein [Chitinispirillaceae bacterium]